eukprot:1904760-Alexandrium_andersonii.AAC.1
MSASLVGSEMCIRDRYPNAGRAKSPTPTGDSGCGPSRPAAPGSARAPQTRTRPRGRASRKSARSPYGRHGPPGA